MKLDLLTNATVVKDAMRFGSEHSNKKEEIRYFFNSGSGKSIVAWYNRGLSLSNLGKYEEAIKSYDKVLEIDPDSLYVCNSKGSALNYLGKYEEAVKSYDRALEIDPNIIVAWYNRGLSLSNLGKYEEAIKSYDKVLEIDPCNTNAADQILSMCL